MGFPMARDRVSQNNRHENDKIYNGLRDSFHQAMSDCPVRKVLEVSPLGWRKPLGGEEKYLLCAISQNQNLIIEATHPQGVASRREKNQTWLRPLAGRAPVKTRPPIFPLMVSTLTLIVLSCSWLKTANVWGVP
jgi:hypothetical protein